MKIHYLVVLPALYVLTTGIAAAQSEGPDPRDARAVVPGIEYRSAFSDYKRYRDPAIGDWRAANDEVGRLGGHMGHTSAGRSETSTKPEGPTPKPTSSPVDPPAGGHGAHHGHGGRR